MESKRAFLKTIDVKLIFNEATQGYAELTRIMNDFSKNLLIYSPKQILLECNTIQTKRHELSLLDKQLHKIVELANTEIQHEPFVDDYRIAFNTAIKACEELHTNLLITKAELLSPSSAGKPN